MNDRNGQTVSRFKETPMHSENVGHIYILSNPNMPNLFKIGFTTRSPNVRLKEISSATGVPGKFEIIKSWEVRNVADMESAIHKRLDNHRVDKEFFRFQSPAESIREVAEFLTQAGELGSNGQTIPEAVRQAEQKKIELEREAGLERYYRYNKKIRHIWEHHGNSIRAKVLELAEQETGSSRSKLEDEVIEAEKVPGSFFKRLAYLRDDPRRVVVPDLKRKLAALELVVASYQSAAEAAIHLSYWKISKFSRIRYDDLRAWPTGSSGWERGSWDLYYRAAPSVGDCWLQGQHKKNQIGLVPFPYESVQAHAGGKGPRTMKNFPKSFKEEAARRAKMEFAKRYAMFVDCSPSEGGTNELDAIVDDRRQRIRKILKELEMERFGL
jgi:hypothetical protein